MTDTTWENIGRIVEWIDEQSPVDDPMQALSMRLHKITEELGEAAQAFIGATAYNPRKGQSHTVGDVKKELCDVILTAMVALRTIDADAGDTFTENLQRVADRSQGRTGQTA